MIKNKKKIEEIAIPEFQQSIDTMPIDSKIFVEKSLEIVNYIHEVMAAKAMRQKDLAAKMGKTEAELSKILSGMHNLTLRSISKLEAALGETIACVPKLFNKSFGKNNGVVTYYTKYIISTNPGPSLCKNVVKMEYNEQTKMKVTLKNTKHQELLSETISEEAVAS
ncbi:MAG: helix-turn-helix transcriptional regulator [Niabella sp.]|nr:helix-turn-helix transcriptional regulator [Niabella sp.]